VILDHFGQIGYMTYAVMYPILVGTACVALGYRQFARGDLL
jgi:ABC-2 type transport system permease protein